MKQSVEKFAGGEMSEQAAIAAAHSGFEGIASYMLNTTDEKAVQFDVAAVAQYLTGTPQNTDGLIRNMPTTGLVGMFAAVQQKINAKTNISDADVQLAKEPALLTAANQAAAQTKADQVAANNKSVSGGTPAQAPASPPAAPKTQTSIVLS